MPRANKTIATEMIAGIREVVGLARTGIDLATRLSVRTYDIPTPSGWTPDRVRELRIRLGIAQPAFAELVGVSTVLVRGWEQGVRKPAPVAARLLDTIAADPAAWLTTIGAELPAFPRSRAKQVKGRRLSCA